MRAQLILAAFLLVGCAPGDDVFIPKSDQEQELECTFTYDQDVCGLTFEVAPERRASVAKQFQSIIDLVSEAHAVLVGVGDACTDLAAALGATPSGVPDADPYVRASLACTAANGALTKAREGSTMTVSGAHVCAATARANCTVLPDRLSCTVSVSVLPADAPAATAIENSMQRLFGYFYEAESLDSAAQPYLFGSVSDDDLPSACAAAVTRFALAGASDLQHAQIVLAPFDAFMEGTL